MADETLSVDIIANASDFTGEVDNASESVDGFKEKCRQTEESTRGLGDETSGLGSKFSALTGVVAGVAQELAGRVLSAIGDLAGEMVEASDSAQKFASTLQFAGIDDSTIQQLTASTQKYADQTVYDLADIRNATAQLAANGVDNYAQLAEAAGNLNAVAGGNADTFKSVSQVMTQTAGSGKLLTENWNQLTDAIPGASGALQDAMRDAGAFEGNFREAMENGEISADEFFAAVQKLGMTDVAKEAATSTATIEGAVGNLEASVVGVGASVIDAFKPFITGTISQVATTISGIGTAFQTASSYVGDWDGKLAEMSQEMGTTATNGDLVALMIEDIGTQLGISTEQSAPFADAIAGIVDSFTPLSEALQGFATTVAPLVTDFFGSLGGLLTSLSPAISMVSSLFATVWTTLTNIATAVAATLLPILTQVIDFVSGTLVPIIMPVIESIVNAVQTAMPAIQAAIETALDVIKGVWDAVWPAIQVVLETVFSIMSGVVQTVMDAINAVITAVMQAISGDWEGAWDTISSFLSGIWDSMVSTVSGAIDSVITFFSNLGGDILSAIGDFGSLLVSAGGDLIDGLLNGISNAAGAVGDMLLGIVDDAIGGVLSFLGIASPSKLMAEIGGYTVEGFTVGVDKQAISAMKDVRSSFADIVGGAETAVSGLTFGGSLSYASPSDSGGESNTYYITIDGSSVGADAELARALDAYAARVRQRDRMKARR